MRIVAGRHKGRRLHAPDGRDLRPTADRTRQAVFNILEHGVADFALERARVLDAFAGTGAYGLEALSRGAAQVHLMDNDPIALACLKANIAALDEDDRCRVLKADVRRPPRAAHGCNLVFLDPPYRQGLIEPALVALAEAGWLAPGAVVVVELAANESLALPEPFVAEDERRHGAARVAILRYRFLDQ